MGLYKLIKSRLYESRCNPLKLEEFSDFAFCENTKCNLGSYAVGTYYTGKSQKQYSLCRLFSKF